MFSSQNWQGKISEWLVCLMAFFSFFSGWFIVAADSQWVRHNTKWLTGLNTPVVDIIAAVTVAFLLLGWVAKSFETKKLHIPQFPAELKWCLFFIASAAISIFFAYDKNYQSAAWNWFRYIVFIYVAYIVALYFFIDKSTVVKNILYIWFGVGTAIALYGLASLFVGGTNHAVTRVSPFPIGGFTPLGVNHNQLAEALIAIIPFGIYFAILFYKKREKVFWLFVACSVLMTVVVMLTLSRAAWLALTVQLLFAIAFASKSILAWARQYKHLLMVLFAVCAVLAGYMGYFLWTSGVVRSSNDARVEATKIVLFYLDRSPFFGFGPGSYMKILTDTRTYVADFGEPLEAHGFLQKIILEEGIIGFVAFILFLLAVFLHLWRAQSAHGIGQTLSRVLFVSAFGIVLFQLFNTEYYSAVMWMPIGVALAFARIRAQHIL